MPHVYRDEYLDHYADRYRELMLRLHGITLLQYLAAPAACEAVAARWAERPEPCPAAILPQQITESEARLERGLEACPRRNGAIVEPLHHHRLPRRSLRCHFTRREQA